MIYMTGDCHGNFLRFTRQQRKQLSYQFSEQDFIMVCGDFGLLWRKNKETEFNIQWLSSLPPVILWVQGNHENYDMIAEYPVENWNGGKVRHIVRDKIILLERGQVFTIEGKQFFTFGGASSHDMPGGILDKDSPDFQKEKKRLKRKKLMYRVRNESWCCLLYKYDAAD
ncbi:MAG: metallophosphoesterase, partial [Lachnospiraceae bacterium]|nr:metallophosphoesterase [Lachnospiraceae bacterium]